MRILFLMTALLTTTALAVPEPEATDVFAAGKNGFPFVRIPSIVVTHSGVLLAFAEGRQTLTDQAQNKIIQRRSLDGGKTWSETSVIADDGARSLNNPCAVVDRKTGRVLLMFQSYPPGLRERSGQLQTGYAGDNIVKSYLMRSDDAGQTWSPMQEMTSQVKRPQGATTLASGPGIGLQLQNGPHAGRVLIPFNEGPYGHWNIYTVYSDDDGTSWQRGDTVPDNVAPDGTSMVNECQLVEIAGARVLFNARRWAGRPVRKTSISNDGGQTWSPVADAPDLMDPSCMASILRVPGQRSRLLYSGPRSTQRENGTVYLSYDEGHNWAVKKSLCTGSFAYSCLVVLPDGTLGCLYETDAYHRIVFARFSLAWLTDGAETGGP